jgi:hypothetical protein
MLPGRRKEGAMPGDLSKVVPSDLEILSAVRGDLTGIE